MVSKVPMMLRTGNKGFTLLEVMIAVSVLALGAVIVYQSFFIAIDSFNYYSALLKIAPWMDEKIWEAQSDLARLGLGPSASGSGELEINNKKIGWGLSYRALDDTGNLYQLNLVAGWPQGSRQVRLTRSAYALYLGKE
jgi:prepilin-type N-terminal cleavage/methylation domain-containing protein